MISWLAFFQIAKGLMDILYSFFKLVADDFAGAETALSPLLNHASRQLVPPEDDKDSFVSDDKEEPSVGDSITVETYLGSNRRRIQVTLTSYQSARHLLNRRQTVHGFILLFSTNSLASFSVMKVHI